MQALVAVVLGWVAVVGGAGVKASAAIDNPAIDMPAFLMLTEEAAALREKHRVTEAEFLRLSRQPDTIVLDARSQEKYDLLHVRGALHLDFSDIAVASLERLIPDRSTRILTTCTSSPLAIGPPTRTRVDRGSTGLDAATLFTASAAARAPDVGGAGTRPASTAIAGRGGGST